MLALDLFNTKYERELQEGAVDDLEARRIDLLNDRMQELLARAKEPHYKNNPEGQAGLKREFQKLKDERDSYYKIREESHMYRGPHGRVDIDSKNGVTRVTRRDYDSNTRADKETAWGANYFPNKDLRGQGTGSAVKSGPGMSSSQGSMRKRPHLDHDANDAPNYEVDEGGIPGSVPTEKIPGKEDLLKGKGRTYYEDQKKNSNNTPLNQKLQRLKVQARKEFPQVDSDQEALLLKLLDKESQDDQQNRRVDARQDAELRKNFAFDQEQEEEIRDLQTGLQEQDDWYDDEDEEETDLRSGDYVRDRLDGEHGEIFRMQGDPNERRVQILDRDGRGWYITTDRLTRVDPNDMNIQRYFGKRRHRDMDEAKWDPWTGGDFGDTHDMNHLPSDDDDKDPSAVSAEQFKAMIQYHGNNALVRRALDDLYRATVGSGYDDSVSRPEKYLATLEDQRTKKTQKQYFKSKQDAYRYANGQNAVVINLVKIDTQEDTSDLITLPVMLGLADHKKKWMLKFPSEDYAQKWEFKHKNAAQIQWPGGHALAEGAPDKATWMKQTRAQYPAAKFMQAKTPGAPIRAYVDNKVVAEFNFGQSSSMAEGSEHNVGDTVNYSTKVAGFSKSAQGGQGKITKKTATHYTINGKEMPHGHVKSKSKGVAEGTRGDAIKQGYQAAVKGLTKQQNPYYKSVNGKTPPEAYDWEAGWEDARDSGKIPQGVAEARRVKGGDYQLKLVDKQSDDDTDLDDVVMDYYFDVYQNGQKIGTAEGDSYYGELVVKPEFDRQFKLSSFHDKDHPLMQQFEKIENGVAESATAPIIVPKRRAKEKKPTKFHIPHKASDYVPPAVALARDEEAKKKKGVAEGWSDKYGGVMRPPTPYSVYIKGRKWKDFATDDHAQAVANKLKAKFKADGRDPETVTIAPTNMSEAQATKTRLDPKCWSGKKIGTPKTKVKGGVRVNNCVPAESIQEDQDTSGVESAIIRRIMVSHTDLLRQFGPEKVMQAAEEVAYNVGDVDEIGTSDVSAYVQQVMQILGATP